MPDEVERPRQPRQRRLASVDPADARLAQLLRKVQWMCDDAAHLAPSRRVEPEQLAELLSLLPLLQTSLRGYARRYYLTDLVEEQEGR